MKLRLRGIPGGFLNIKSKVMIMIGVDANDGCSYNVGVKIDENWR
jgi:hypothetical protein